MKKGKALIIVENNSIPLDRRVWYEATALREAGWQVTVINPAANGAHFNQSDTCLPYSINQSLIFEGINVYFFPLKFADHGLWSYFWEYTNAFFWIARLSWRVWLEQGFDVLQFCNPPDFFFPIGWFYRILGAKVIFDHHDLFPEMILNRYRGRIGRIFFGLGRLAEFLTLRSANLVIATNESFKRIAQDRGKVSKNRIVVVRNGPKVDEFSPVGPLLALKMGFPFMVCFLGIMGEDDGIGELVDSIQYIIQELGREDIRFVLIGDGSMRAQTVAKIASLGLNAWVEMPGLVRETLKLRQYLSTADLCVSPEPLTPMNSRSTFIKVGEYMAMEKPIVAFDLPETRLTAQNAAVYVNPGDIHAYARAIVELIDNPESRRIMGAIGRQRIVESLSWEHQKQNLLQAYQLVLQLA